MPPFRFRLEQVRLYRKQLEEQAMQAMARAVMERDALLERIDALEKSLTALRTALCRPESMSAAQRWLTQGYLNAQKLDLEAARRALREAEQHVDVCRENLVQKAKDRGLLDSLKEKQAARHLLQERQQEQKINDETATLRYKPAAI